MRVRVRLKHSSTCGFRLGMVRVVRVRVRVGVRVRVRVTRQRLSEERSKNGA